MKLARLLALPFLAASALAACSGSPTAPAAPDAAPRRVETSDCAVKIAVTQEDGTVLYVCQPNMGSGG